MGKTINNEELRKQYPNNSLQAQKEAGKDTSPVVKHQVMVKKKTLADKADGGIFMNTAKSAADDILTNVLIPAAKGTFFEMCSGFLRSILFGDRNLPVTTNRSSFGSVNYGSFYNRKPEQTYVTTQSYDRRSLTASLETFIFENYSDAEAVFNKMVDFLETYGRVTVSDYYEITGFGTPPTFTYQNYGWKNLSSVRIIRSGAGWTLSLPPIEVV